MKRFIASLLGVIMTVPTLFMTPTAALADSTTGAWTWTDISSQLTTSAKRPVWAVAYGNGSWFYTDGQNLWNGGQAYRYDGTTQVNITFELRNAGIDRVDDIVSDGNTILFLQDIARGDNQLRVVTLRNGQYVNLTTQVRNLLRSDENVSSLTGRNGAWYVVTTHARLFRLTDNGSVTEVTLPSGIQNNVESSRATLRYNVNHGSAVNGTGRLPLAMVPVANNNWLLMADPHNGPVRFYRYDGSSFADITGQFPVTDSVTKISTNNTNALLMGTGSNGTWTRLANGNSTAEINGLGNIFAENRTIWNGKSWLVLQGKQVYRVNGSFNTQTAESYGPVADLFLQGASDNNGRLLLGGAKSETWTNDPTSPLTAKLVMVTEGVAAPRVLGTTTSVGGPQITVNGTPSDFRIGNGREFVYRVTATDPHGVNRIDLYVNDALIRTCLSATSCEYRATYWTSGDAMRTVKFWARATDALGNVTANSGNPNILTVDINSGAGANSGTATPPGTVAGTSNTTGYIWTWMEPNQTTLFVNQSVNFRVGANDADGLNRVEIMANGSVVRTCNFNNVSGNQTCDAALFADTYTQGSSIFVNAKATDRHGNTVWSNGTTFFRANDGTVNPPVVNPPATNNQQNPAVWDWMDPNVQTISGTESTDYRVGAWDENGLERIEIIVNGTHRNTCNLNGATGNRECTWRIHAREYTAGSNVFVNGKATDRNGNVSWTGGKTVHIGSINTSGIQNTVNVSANKSTYTYGDRILFTATTHETASVDRLDIYMNDVKIKTCHGVRTCNVIMGPFVTNTTVRYAAVLTLPNGDTVTTGYKSIPRQ